MSRGEKQKKVQRFLLPIHLFLTAMQGEYRLASHQQSRAMKIQRIYSSFISKINTFNTSIRIVIEEEEQHKPLNSWRNKLIPQELFLEQRKKITCLQKNAEKEELKLNNLYIENKYWSLAVFVKGIFPHEESKKASPHKEFQQLALTSLSSCFYGNFKEPLTN